MHFFRGPSAPYILLYEIHPQPLLQKISSVGHAWRLLAALIPALTKVCYAIAATPTPAGPEVVQGTARAEVVLNGLWRFQPLLPGASAPSPDESQ